jgi:tetratricopeptide (TPR) repeat protein
MTLSAGLLALFLAQASAAPAATPPAGNLTGSGDARFEQCAALLETNAERAYEEGMAWAAETHELGGYRCAAMALIEQGRHEDGARRLESLATLWSGEADTTRAELLSQAGNAWLLARDPAHARSAFTRAITLMEGSEYLPDILIDRARAYAAEQDYRHAEEDLSRALDLKPNDALALRLRADARMRQNSFDLALADAQASVAQEPTNVDALLMLGHAREAQRTQQPVQY